MEIVVETTEYDHIDFWRDYSLRRNWLQRCLFLIIAGLILSAFRPISSVYLINLLFLGIILAPLFIGIPYFESKKRIRKAYDSIVSPTALRMYKPFASGIEITGESPATFLRYEDIRQVGRTGNFIYLVPKFGGYYLLPVGCFSSVEEIEHFFRVVKNGVANTKGVPVKEPFTFKPGYLVAILCLIPVIGFFAGLVVLILGIVHYKDKVYIIMGAIGMLITIGIYGSMIYFVQTSGIVKDGFANIAQIQLNDLVKDIEFYKLQNGAYPDSLQQIQTKDSFTSIDDPTQAINGNKKSVTYQYQRKGNKYLLFSVGKDGIANTADDIYPNLSNADTSKLGFIRK
ncbi:type II secretion system protein GspG [Mucilaginibacter gotjawali]|uniref:Uncharacterized protein n=2 Tax=Mucilaginibacter gotjawali TaxID=1550579 RepID=A0A120MXZ1_9SPHI|nr:type II secretion system protein GspG [Mucilaginibacter gotjawali]MBB3057950.1 hypothetical protein [Mucilaginibacter gotjawali]BAU52278.1 hypothetical protein MgSA37_00433 [Mucilaginibacter gotjawali]